MFYSILYFKPSTEKNDSLKVLMSLNPEGPLGSYLCDFTLPCSFDHASVSLKVEVNITEHGGKRGGIFLSTG